MNYVNRLMLATPTTGVIRMEWAVAMQEQVIPANWSLVRVNQLMDSYIPFGQQVADAQNLVVRQVIDADFEWLLLIGHDMILPNDAFGQFNKWIREKKAPVVSGLYFTKAVPSEPLIYRGDSIDFYNDWELGDIIFCDNVPTGCLLIHTSILRAMWQESDEYMADGQLTRRIFDAPYYQRFELGSKRFYQLTGADNLAWYSRIIRGGFFGKTGWHEYQNMKYPFPVDTNIFCKNIDMNGVQYPIDIEIARWKLGDYHAYRYPDKNDDYDDVPL